MTESEVIDAAREADTVAVPAEIVRFLNGAAPFLGVWFGDCHPSYPGRYWWRNFLPPAPLVKANAIRGQE